MLAPSNRRAPNPLSRTCVAAGRAAPGADRLAVLLDSALDATGAERAFLVTSPRADGPPSVDGARCRRRDGLASPSRSAVARALAAGARGAVRALAADTASVRALDLRAVLAIPLPVVAPGRAALVLDSRNPLDVDRAGPADALEAIASLVAIALEAGPPRVVTIATGDDEVGGRSLAIARVRDEVRRAAGTDLPVLVEGETGSGKERVCRALHRASRRGAGPLVAVNCGAVSETLLEAELFGAVRGAYTGSDRDRPGLFRQAHGGTLVLDEVGDMPRTMQTKLLRAIEEARVRPVGGADEVEIDVRVLAATHRDLDDEVERGRFRADLFHRLAVLRIKVPPLRNRIDDLPEIVDALAPRLERVTGRRLPALTEGAWRRLSDHDWPGNVRELYAVLARAVMRASGPGIDARDLDLLGPRRDDPSIDASVCLEREMIASALAASDGIVTEAARRIGWSRQKLYRRMRTLGVELQAARR